MALGEGEAAVKRRHFRAEFLDVPAQVHDARTSFNSGLK
jgi:hypothetical protein